MFIKLSRSSIYDVVFKKFEIDQAIAEAAV